MSSPIIKDSSNSSSSSSQHEEDQIQVKIKSPPKDEATTTRNENEQQEQQQAQPQPQPLQVCDVCGYKDGFKHMILIECEQCHVTVHRDCYGMPTYTQKHFTCWACQAVGKTFAAQQAPHRSNVLERSTIQITQTQRPTHCSLCGYHDDNDDEKVVHAMHPVYDNYGDRARQLCTPMKDNKNNEHRNNNHNNPTPYELVWAHTICGFFLCTKRLMYAVSQEGMTHEGLESDPNDDRSVNPALVCQDEDEEEGDDLFGGYAPTHHFVFYVKERVRVKKTKPNMKVEMEMGTNRSNNDDEDVDGKSTANGNNSNGEDNQDIDKGTKNESGNENEDDNNHVDTTNKSSQSTITMFRHNEWSKQVQKLQENLTCEICKLDDSPAAEGGVYRIAVQCSAGDNDEYRDFRTAHHDLNLDKKEKCIRSFHVGCARWVNQNQETITDDDNNNNNDKYRRVYYYPGLPDTEEEEDAVKKARLQGTREQFDPMRCLYCPGHAKDVNKEERALRIEREEEKHLESRDRRKQAMRKRIRGAVTLSDDDEGPSLGSGRSRSKVQSIGRAKTTNPFAAELKRVERDVASKIIYVKRENATDFINQQKKLWKQKLVISESIMSEQDFKKNVWPEVKKHAQEMWFRHEAQKKREKEQKKKLKSK